MKWWMIVFNKRGPKPSNVYDYSSDELFGLYRKAIDPEMQELTKLLNARQNIPKKTRES